MSQASNYILRTPIQAIQFFSGDMFRLAPEIVELLDDDAESTFFHNSHVEIEFDDFSTVTAHNLDFIVRVGEDIEVFTEQDFHSLFVKLG